MHRTPSCSCNTPHPPWLKEMKSTQRLNPRNMMKGLVSSVLDPTDHAPTSDGRDPAPCGQSEDKAGTPALSIDIVEQRCRAESRPERRELASVIDEYPLCKRLMEAYRRVYHMPNKTPLSILFEYASRLNLQVCHPLMIEQMFSGTSCIPWTGLHAAACCVSVYLALRCHSASDEALVGGVLAALI